jgi:hypothetical protein
MISQAAAGQLVRGKLPFIQALELGTAIMDAAELPNALVDSAFTAAYPVGTFSDFVCTEVAGPRDFRSVLDPKAVIRAATSLLSLTIGSPTCSERSSSVVKTFPRPFKRFRR